jgi:hypothetical protein
VSWFSADWVLHQNLKKALLTGGNIFVIKKRLYWVFQNKELYANFKNVKMPLRPNAPEKVKIKKNVNFSLTFSGSILSQRIFKCLQLAKNAPVLET